MRKSATVAAGYACCGRRKSRPPFPFLATGRGEDFHRGFVSEGSAGLTVVVGVVQADLRPGANADVVVVVGVRLEPGQPGLVNDPGGVVDAQTVEEGAAVGGDREPEAVRAEQADQRLGDEVGLECQPEIVARRLLVHRVEEIAGAALGHGPRGPERGVQLGRERVRGIGGRARPEQREVLQRARALCAVIAPRLGGGEISARTQTVGFTGAAFAIVLTCVASVFSAL